VVAIIKVTDSPPSFDQKSLRNSQTRHHTPLQAEEEPEERFHPHQSVRRPRAIEVFQGMAAVSHDLMKIASAPNRKKFLPGGVWEDRRATAPRLTHRFAAKTLADPESPLSSGTLQSSDCFVRLTFVYQHPTQGTKSRGHGESCLEKASAHASPDQPEESDRIREG